MVAIRPISLAILMLALLPASAAATSTTQIIIKRDPGLSAGERADIRADAGVRFVETLPLPRTEVVAAAPGDFADALRDLNADPDVVYATRNGIRRAAADPETDDLWGLHRVEALDAWTYDRGTGATVAVVDSGIDASHPDLADRIVDQGYDFIANDNDPSDLNGHGTHVAGTIAATKDGAGVAGVAPEAGIVPLRVLNAAGSGPISAMVRAYDWAGDHDVPIVNASLAGIGADPFEYEAIKRNPDVLFVVAAGNGDDPDDTFPYQGDDNDDADFANYPCAYDLPNILCVGATDENDDIAEFSNFGEKSVDVFAPGVGIESTTLGGGYEELDGTSMATPHVTGAAALLMSESPGLTPAKVVEAVIEWSDFTPVLDELAVSGGIANAFSAIEFNDADGDGHVDRDDNCPVHANPQQAIDDDTDGLGNVCDPTPRGVDVDGDGVGAIDDLCPAQTGNTANGCYVAPSTPPSTGGGTTPPSDRDGDGVYDISDACPTVSAATANGCPIAQVRSVSTRTKKRRGKRSATVRVSTTGVATVRITVERKRGRRWVRVTRKAIVTSGDRATLTVKRLRRGAHRVRISISSGAGRGTPVTKRFRVR